MGTEPMTTGSSIAPLTNYANADNFCPIFTCIYSKQKFSYILVPFFNFFSKMTFLLSNLTSRGDFNRSLTY